MKIVNDGSWKVIGNPKNKTEKALLKFNENIKRQSALNAVQGLLELKLITINDYKDIKYRIFSRRELVD